MPEAVVAKAAGPKRLSYGDLTSSVHKRVDTVEPLVEHVVAVVQARQDLISKVKVFDGIDVDGGVLGLEFSVRTRNALLREPEVLEPRRMNALTWGRLLSIPSLGVRSALEFAVVVERSGRSGKASRGSDSPIAEGLSKKSERQLRRFARASWAAGLALNDPRLGLLRRTDRRTVAEAADEALLQASAGETRDAESLLAVLDAIADIGERIEALPLEPLLSDVIATLMDERGDRLHALAARMGLDGERVTFRAAGAMAGLSGARLQQIHAKLAKRVARHRFLYLPALERAVQALSESSPLRIADGEQLLRSYGISKGRVDLVVLVDDWLRLLGRDELRLVEYSGEVWVIRPELGSAEEQLSGAGYLDSESEVEVLAAARRLCRSVGVASVRWVCDEVELDDDRDTRRGVRRAIKSAEWSRFLDQNWFWDPSVPLGRNRLENTLRKLLAVSPEVRSDDVLEALERLFRQGRLPQIPSVAAVVKFAAAHPGFDVVDDHIVSLVPLSPESDLGQTEQIFVEVLGSAPGHVLDRDALRRACVERGMNAATFGQYTSFSPILMQPGRNLWALRGRSPDSGAVQRAGSNVRRRRRHATATLTSDDELLVTWNVAGPESAVFAIPSAARSGFVDSEYAAASAEGVPVGTVKVDPNGTSWGYGPFLRLASASSGGTLVARFNADRGTVTLDFETGADRLWVGDIATCFLHDLSWALRLYVDSDLIGGSEWSIPVPLADAVGLADGRRTIPWRKNTDITLTVTRSRNACTASSLKRVLEAVGANAGERVFVELHSEWFDVRRRGRPDRMADPFEELLASTGLESLREPREQSWNRLCRAIGGSATGTRDAVEERLRERGDSVGLGLVQMLRPAAVVHRSEWPDGWPLFAPLDGDEARYAVRSETGSKRVAVAVATDGVALPAQAVVTGGGVVWLDQGPSVDEVVQSLRGMEGVVLCGAEQGWVDWARAEHGARCAASRGEEFSIEAREGSWILGDGAFDDLKSALSAVKDGSSFPSAPSSRSVRAPYPRDAFAFRRLAANFIRMGLVELRSNGEEGFLAVFEDGRTRSAASLAELL